MIQPLFVRRKVNYNFAVVSVFSLWQLFVAVLSLVQQVLPFAHFFLFFLPPSANEAEAINKPAVASKNTFLILFGFNFYDFV